MPLADKIEQYLSTMDTINKYSIKLVLRLFNWSPLLFLRGIRFTWLSDEKKLEFIKECDESKYYFKRMQIFLPKFLINMFFYADPKVEKAIGYTRHCESVTVENGKEA